MSVRGEFKRLLADVLAARREAGLARDTDDALAPLVERAGPDLTGAAEAALACVDWVVLFGEQTPLALIRTLRPDVLAKGGDWRPGEIVGSEDVLGWGGRVERLRVVPGIRSTVLVERAKQS